MATVKHIHKPANAWHAIGNGQQECKMYIIRRMWKTKMQKHRMIL